MKTAIAILIILHGLIHLPGFLKAYSFAEIKEIQNPVPKHMGILWLLTSGILIAAGILLFLGVDDWWKVSVTGITLSQILIIQHWKDARFGTLINLFIALGIALNQGL